MNEDEKYEEFRKYYEKAEEREQRYIVEIQRLMLDKKKLERSCNETKY